jgi:ribosomal protein S19
MKRKRFAWAKKHVKWTTMQWDKVIFPDESKFNLHVYDGKQYVSRRINAAEPYSAGAE